MIRLSSTLASSCLATCFATCLLLPGAAIAEETPPATQVFLCNFLDGKDMADVDKATEFFKKQIEKIDSADLNACLFVSYRCFARSTSEYAFATWYIVSWTLSRTVSSLRHA